MTDLLFLLLLFLLAKGKDLTTYGPPQTPPQVPPEPRRRRRRREQPQTPPEVPPHTTPPMIPPDTYSPTSTPPWPQSVPSGLPPFPSGWEPDEPVGAGVAARAFELLPQLWTYGVGTRKTEQTNGRWITYVAMAMGSKKGVVAYRLRPGQAPAPSATTPASSSPVALRTLRRGDSGPDVVVLQQRLGIPADGKFGPGTQAAVIAYQRSRGLSPDGVVGPATWGSLMGSKA